MPPSSIDESPRGPEDTLEHVAKTLHSTADALADDAEHAIAAAAKALRDAAGAIVAKAPEPAKALVRRATEEAKAHPIASTAAVLGAAAALIGLLASTRKNPVD